MMSKPLVIAMAVAAAVAGLIRWTMPPLPMRPLKFLLVVAAQISPLNEALPTIPSIDPGQPDPLGYNPTISGLKMVPPLC